MPRIDFTFVHLAMQFLETGSTFTLYELSGSSATIHMLAHARYMHKPIPVESSIGFVSYLLTPREEKARNLSDVRDLVIAVEREEKQQHKMCVEQALRYLPGDYAYAGVLFFTYGYELEASLGENASLNLADPHFSRRPQEVWLHCIQQLYRVGFHYYHEQPYIGAVATTRDLQDLVEYRIQVDGMAVHAAFEERERRALLGADADYVALGDSILMEELESQFFELYDAIRAAPARVLTAADRDALRAIVEDARLTSRVGALMARRIERAEGRSRLRRLVYSGPGSFIAAYEDLRDQGHMGSIDAPPAGR